MQSSRLSEMPGLLERALARAMAKGAGAAKVSYWQDESISCGFENAKLKSTETRQSLRYSIDVIAGGRRGSTQGNDVGDLEDLVDRAVALAKIGGAAHFSSYPAPSPVIRVRTHSPGTLELTRERMIESCTAIAGALKAHDPELFIEAGASRNEAEGLIMTTGGVRQSWRNTGWDLNGSVQRMRGTDMLFAGEGRSWRDLNDFFDPGYIADKIAKDLRRSEKTVDPPSGTTTVLLPPDLVRMFLYPVLAGAGGRNVAKGDSPLKGRLGEKILDSSLTIIDDPHRDFDGGASETDGDGIPTRKFEIVREGVLKGFLYDLDSAGLAGAEPTGHNGCWPHSLMVLPGPKRKDDLFASVSDGLYVKDLIGFGQSNMMNGDVSGNVALGFRVRGGEITGRVKDTMVAGNVYQLLRDGVEVSSETDPVSRMPYMKIAGVAVSSSQKK